MKKTILIGASSLFIGFIGGYFMRSKKKVNTCGTLNIRDEVDDLYLSLDKEISDLRKMKVVTFTVSKIR